MPDESYRQALIDEIYDAFRTVSRKGGVSWSEAYVIDMYGSEQERAAARAKDKDACWQELVEPSKWDDRPGVGGWSFLDPIGFRYYLPAAMVRGLRNEESDIAFWLTPSEGRLREWTIGKWSLLDERQRNCVKSFINFMIHVTLDDPEWGYEPDDWAEARDQYWHSM